MNLQEVTHKKFRWLNIREPDAEMVNFLKDNFRFHPLDLEDVLSKVQYPKIDAYQDYLFIILQFPVFESDRRIYRRTELDMFFGRDYLITINSGRLAGLQNFFETCLADEVAREKFMGRGGPLLLYEIIDAMFSHVFPILNQKNEAIFQLEEEIYETPQTRDMIQEIMVLKRDIINIRRILGPERSVLQALQQKHPDFIPPEYAIYFDDILDKKDKLMNQLDTIQQYVNVLEGANEALLTRSTNKVIKTLTVFSVIVLPMNLLMNYYAMNVQVPLQNNPHILAILNTAFLTSVIGLLIFFGKRGWLS